LTINLSSKWEQCVARKTQMSNTLKPTCEENVMLSITELPHKNLARITGTIPEDLFAFMIISRLK